MFRRLLSIRLASKRKTIVSLCSRCSVWNTGLSMEALVLASKHAVSDHRILSIQGECLLSRYMFNQWIRSSNTWYLRGAFVIKVKPTLEYSVSDTTDYYQLDKVCDWPLNTKWSHPLPVGFLVNTGRKTPCRIRVRRSSLTSTLTSAQQSLHCWYLPGVVADGNVPPFIHSQSLSVFIS